MIAPNFYCRLVTVFLFSFSQYRLHLDSLSKLGDFPAPFLLFIWIHCPYLVTFLLLADLTTGFFIPIRK